MPYWSWIRQQLFLITAWIYAAWLRAVDLNVYLRDLAGLGLFFSIHWNVKQQMRFMAALSEPWSSVLLWESLRFAPLKSTSLKLHANYQQMYSCLLREKAFTLTFA